MPLNKMVTINLGQAGCEPKAAGRAFRKLLAQRFAPWLRRTASKRVNDPQYTPSLCFDRFPFPEAVIPRHPELEAVSHELTAVAVAAKRLDDLRSAWLNPPELVRVEPEVVPGFPDRSFRETKPPQDSSPSERYS